MSKIFFLDYHHKFKYILSSFLVAFWSFIIIKEKKMLVFWI